MQKPALTKPSLFAIVAVSICFAILFISQPISAHANLLQSSPKPSEELDTPPERVIIWFTEPIEAAFSSISVLDSAGKELTAGAAAFDATEPTAMWVPLQPLENGTYLVVWRNVSSVDGHKVTGSFLFAVGETLAADSISTVTEQPLLQSPADPFVRWAIYIGIAVFVGGIVFELLIATRVARANDDTAQLQLAQKTGLRFGIIAVAAIFVVIAAQFVQLAIQTAVAFDDALAFVQPAQVFDLLTESDWGRFWSWRLTVALLAATTLFAAIRTVRRNAAREEPDDLLLVTETPFGIGALALGGIYLLLISLTSHNAATPSDIRLIAISTDLIHIIAATIWIGGIAFLVSAAIYASRCDDTLARGLVLQLATGFAPLAILVVSVLVISGIVSSLMQVSIPEAIATPYGWVLVGKVALLALLVGLAIKNNRTVAKYTSDTATDVQSLTRYISIELGVVFTVLLATAGLASLEPARQYAERNGIGVADYAGCSENVNGADVDIKLEPGNTGPNTLTINISEENGSPFPNVDEVRARLKYLDDDFGEYFVPVPNVSPGKYILEDATIAIVGAYQLDVTVVRSDAFDSHISFRFDATSPTLASDLIRPSLKTSLSAFGFLIAAMGAAYMVAYSIGRPPIRLRLNAGHGVAILVAVIGSLMVLNAQIIGIGLPQTPEHNPFPLTQESVQIGRESYVSTCATCHGDAGRGDGAAGIALNPAPADLAVHVPLHTDIEIYSFIADGIDGTTMVPQLGNLTEDEIWHLVNYLRTIRE